MRLFDKVAQHKSSVCNFKADPPQCVLCADAIASHVHNAPKETWLPSDYPFALPPWTSVFVEWNVPPTLNLSGRIVANDDDARQAGMSINLSCPLTKQDMKLIYGNAWPWEEGTTSHLVHAGVYGRLFGVVNERVVEPDVIWTCFLDREGNYLASGVIGPDAEHYVDMISHYKAIVLMAFTFVNCANVKLEDVTDEVAPIPKIRRRLKIPEVKRYTLNIAGHVARPSRDYNEGPKGVMPFHLCRGHFATYTAEKPMFGNPKLVGRYWHPPHMKGKKENGEIVKDYAIA